MKIKHQVKCELARREFWSYCNLMAGDFYKVDRQYLIDLCNEMQDFYNSFDEVLIINAPPRHGKLIADYEPILTRNGWKNHGDIVKGDFVVSPNGEFVEVIDVLPKGVANVRVTMTNGETVDVNELHEWIVYDRNKKKEIKLETIYMMNEMQKAPSEKRRGHRYRFQLPNKQPLKGEKKSLLVDPYVLGAWLGDGNNTKAVICSSEEDKVVIEECSKFYNKLATHIHKSTKVIYQSFENLRRDLHNYGMCVYNKRTEKHIPEEYLTASIEQRLELLAGLLDTDGSLRVKEHRYIFTTSDEQLKETFIKLIATFGWRTCVMNVKPTKSTSNIIGKKAYWQIGFNPTMFIPCRIERKQLYEYSKQRKISIKKIEWLENPTQGNCISVDGGVYCVGKTMLPTHNSRTATLFVQWVLGQDINNKIMTGSYNETLSTTFSKAVRNRIQEGKASDDILVYSDVFPNVKVKRGDGASNLWGLEGTGTNSYLATSPTGTATGFGADIILIDDIIKNEYEARTESILDKHYSWYTDTLFSRLEGKRKLILIMTRWATSDLAGRIISDCEKNGEPYRLLSFKAYDGENMLCDDVLDYEHYKKISDNISNEIMQANYNQQPIDVQGVLYPELKTYEQLPELSQIKCYVDTADTGTDYLCSIIYGIGLKDNLNYILDVVYTQQGMEITEPLVAERLNAYNVNICAIESNNGGRGFARNVQTHLKQMGNTITKIRWFTQTKNKQARILTGSTGVMNTILFPFDWHKRWREFYRDVTRYQRAGKNAHDDSVDCLTGVYEMTPKKKQSENINPAFM